MRCAFGDFANKAQKRLCFLDKFFFADSANRANPVFWQIFKSGAGGDTVIRITYFGVVDVSAGVAFVFGHVILLAKWCCI